MTPLERRVLLTLLRARGKMLPVTWFDSLARRRVLQSLKRTGMVEPANGSVKLTPQGVLIARRAQKRSDDKTEGGTKRKRAVQRKD